MIRILVFLIIVTLLALGAAWIVDRPGEIVMTWQGWRVSTSVTVALVALFSLLTVAILLWSLLRYLVTAPNRVTEYVHERRQLRGWNAISRGLIAIGTGNAYEARRSAHSAERLLGKEPLVLLLSAQAAQLNGDAAAAEAEFRRMLEHEDTKALGLRGLYIEARRRNDSEAAFTFAEEAARTDPALTWAGEALVEFNSRNGIWDGALEAVDRQIAAKALPKAEGKRRRAVLIAAQAMASELTNPAHARELAAASVKLAPDLVPAVALSARLEGRGGNLRKANKLVEKAWALQPHPDLAEVYAELSPGDTARDRLKRVKALAKKAPTNPESIFAVARAAIDANDFGQAREMLEPLLADPTQRTCMLMAEIEAKEFGDHGKAREWTARAVRARRDPAWVADGYVSDQWLPASPLTGKLDAFAWMVPPASIGGPVLMHEAAVRPSAAPEPVKADIEIRPVLAPKSPGAGKPAKTESRKIETKPALSPVIAEPPLPDDPGPEPDAEAAMPRKRFSLFDWFARPAS
jgi:HemY protein